MLLSKNELGRRVVRRESGFYRDVSLLGAALALFAYFTTMGHLPFAVTGSLLNLR